ncbi:periplasmic phosphate-binding protein of phosphate ABC transporter [Leptolyngbya sp. NIES-3755]|nr:periplasmic phosphate-binding protein of phosphate ABC transporter [Leptolyngbya sp. NIES-3755]
MTQKNETPALVLSFLLVAGILGGGFWWFSRSWTGLSPTVSQNQSTGEALSFATVQNVPSGLFNYGGSTTWAPIRRDLDPALQIVWTNFRLRYTDPIQGAPGSGVGIQMLIDNQLAFAQSSRSIKESEHQAAKQKGFSLKEIPVAIDGIAIAVNPNLGIKGLTIEQLASIYEGKITNWNQVGGTDLEIIPLSRRPEDSGTIEFFIENVMQKQPLGNSVRYIGSTTQAIREIANNPGAIYYASAPEIVPQCTIKAIPIGRKPEEFVSPYQDPQFSDCKARSLNIEAFQTGRYPITRRLLVIVKQNGQIDEQAGEAYARLLLTNQGQDLIAKSGFVRLR